MTKDMIRRLAELAESNLDLMDGNLACKKSRVDVIEEIIRETEKRVRRETAERCVEIASLKVTQAIRKEFLEGNKS